jgi:hypothetical protein
MYQEFPHRDRGCRIGQIADDLPTYLASKYASLEVASRIPVNRRDSRHARLPALYAPGNATHQIDLFKDIASDAPQHRVKVPP